MRTASVVGLGKIGLPLAVQIASAGWRVQGADISARVVDLVNRATPPFPNETHLDERLAEVVGSGVLTATLDVEAAVAESEVVLVVVPLIVDDQARPDFGPLDSATSAIGRALRPGSLVSYETTLPVGTTRNRFAARLAEMSDLTLGQNLFVCHSPERVFSGRIFSDLKRYPKLVGGVDEASEKRAVDFYSSVLTFDEREDLPRPNGVWSMGSSEAAELAKLAETTYRDVNIALANEFAAFAQRASIDIDAVITAANSQPFSHIHRPGIAVGGHCIPVYPRFYLSVDDSARLPAVARAVNDAAPERAVQALEDAVGPLSDRRVVVLGAAFRGDVKETAFSGVFGVVAALQRRGATALVHDPLYSTEELQALDLRPYELGDPIDLAIVQANHRAYLDLGPDDLPGVKAVLDGRGDLNRGRWPGVTFLRIGSPPEPETRDGALP